MKNFHFCFLSRFQKLFLEIGASLVFPVCSNTRHTKAQHRPPRSGDKTTFWAPACLLLGGGAEEDVNGPEEQDLWACFLLCPYHSLPCLSKRGLGPSWICPSDRTKQILGFCPLSWHRVPKPLEFTVFCMLTRWLIVGEAYITWGSRLVTRKTNHIFGYKISAPFPLLNPGMGESLENV